MIKINKIKILIVDDSRFVRQQLTENLNKELDLLVIDSVENPYEARESILKEKPDVVLLDINMPLMDGLSFLKKLMKSYPLKVIIVSSLAQKGGEISLKAIEAGALEVISKPSQYYPFEEMFEELVEKIRAVNSIGEDRLMEIQEMYRKKSKTSKIPFNNIKESHKNLIVIGASTGGTDAIDLILSQLPPDSPPVLIVQHMPGAYTKSFAKRLNNASSLTVREARDNEILSSGLALIAPGNSHLLVVKQGTAYYVKIVTENLVNHHRPSFDVLLHSVSKFDCSKVVAIILTGMGKDGVISLKDVHNKKAYTIAQDEETCVVFGMPKAAIEIGAVDKVLPIASIASEIVNFYRKGSSNE